MEDFNIVRPSAISSRKIRGKTNKTKNTMISSNPHNLVSVGAFIFLEGTIK